MYSRAVGAMLLAFLVALVLARRTDGDRRVTAMPTEFYVVANNWMRVAETCPNMDDSQDVEYRSRHPWALYCATGPYNMEHGCSRCLQVTNVNRAAGDDTSLTVRIVDICSNLLGVPLYIDQSAFNEIVTDNDQGNYNAPSADGVPQLEVNIESVDCEDPE